MDWRKVKIGEYVLTLPGQFLCIMDSIGAEGRDGADTKVYLRKVDTGARVMARVTQITRPRGQNESV